MTRETVIRHINRQRGERTWQQFADAVGLTLSQLHMAANGKRPPGPLVLAKFGIEKVEEYRMVSK